MRVWSRVLRTVLVATVTAQIGFLGSCSLVNDAVQYRSNTDRAFSVVSWNLQNIFDGVQDGGEYLEFDPELSPWDEERFRKRCATVRSALVRLAEGRLDGSLPDVLVLQELENARVLDQISSEMRWQAAYPYRMVRMGDAGPVHVAVLSRLELVSTLAHRVMHGEHQSRFIWELCLTPNRLLEAAGIDQVVVFANHWKSKSGGESESEGLRRSAAQIIAERTREIQADNPQTLCVVAGDLNEDPRDRLPLPRALCVSDYLQYGGAGSADGWDASMSVADPADVPLDPGQSILWLTDPQAVNSPLNSKVASLIGSGRVWMDSWRFGNSQGSYFYDGHWEQIDHILVNNTFGLEASFEAWADSELVSPAGIPIRYDPRTGKGCTDHLPVVLRLGDPAQPEFGQD